MSDQNEKKTTKNRSHLFDGSRPGPGRPKGVPNKQTKEIKEMLMQSLEDVGGADYFTQLSTVNPAAYASLLGKIIPAEVKNQITGAYGGPIQHAVKVKFGD